MEKIPGRKNRIILALAVILISIPINSFSEEILKSKAGELDPVASEMVNEFLLAVNSGERKAMQDFILKHYDQRALGRIPVFAVVTLNLGFFYCKSAAGREISHKGDGQGMNCHFKSFLDAGYTYIVLSNYSAPSANIIASVIDQLISSINAVK